MEKRFVIEAVMMATYGGLLQPGCPVNYVIPYSSIAELYELRSGAEPVMDDPADDRHVKEQIGSLIALFEEPLNRKKIERALQQPWRESAPLLLNNEVSVTVINAVDSDEYEPFFDPIETEQIITGMRLEVPILSDQLEFEERIIETGVAVIIFDIEDFDYALETNE